MSKTKYNDNYSYEIFDDGYDIYQTDGDKEFRIISQRDPYGKVFKPDGTYEDNAIEQLDEMTSEPEPIPVSELDQIKANIDYIAVMTDIDLPNPSL